MRSVLGWLGLLALLFTLLGLPLCVSAQAPVITAGDKIQVTCEEEPALNREYVVTQDGLVLLSFVGAVKVAGLTETQAANLIRDELIRQRILRSATVTVKLKTADSLPIKYIGAVKQNGEVAWKDGIRLSDVIKLAEPTPAADLTKVRIEPREGRVLVVDFSRFDGRDLRYNPELRPGDRVIFELRAAPQQVFVLGAVTKPGSFDHQPGMTLSRALELAGGLLGDADGTKIRREATGKPTLTWNTRTDLDAVVSPGDRITVGFLPRSATVTVEGGVAKPGSVPVQPGLTLLRALELSGGLAPGVKPGKVKVVRREGERSVTRSIDLKRIMDGYEGDMELKAGDRVLVPNPKGGRNRDLLTLAGILIGVFIFGGG